MITIDSYIRQLELFVKYLYPVFMVLFISLSIVPSVHAAVQSDSLPLVMEEPIDLFNEFDSFDFNNSMHEILGSKEYQAAQLTKDALVELHKGNRQEGLNILKKAWDLSPNLLEIGIIIGWVQLEDKQFDEALKVANKLQSMAPEKSFGYTLAGISYRGLNETESAISMLSKAWSLSPGNPDAGNNLAKIMLTQGHVDEARKIYTEILEKNPKHLTTMLMYSQLEMRVGGSDKVKKLHSDIENVLKEILTEKADFKPAEILLAKLLYSQNRNQEAKPLIDKILRDSPQDPAILELSGVNNLKLALFDEAESNLVAAISVSQNQPTLHYNLAEVYARSNKLDLALSEVDKTLHLYPQHSAARFLKAILLTRMGKLAQAQDVVNTLTPENPGSLDLQELQASIFLEQKKFSEAIGLLKKILEKRSTNILLIKLAKAQKESGDTENALNTLRGWLTKHPSDVLSKNVLADLLFDSGLYEEAQKHYLEILTSQANNLSVRNNLALAYSKQGLSSKGLAEAEKNYQLAPNNPAVMDTLAVLLIQNKKIERAVELLEKALKTLPDNNSVRLHYAQALAANKGNKENLDKAKAILKELVREHKDFGEVDAAVKLLKEVEQ